MRRLSSPRRGGDGKREKESEGKRDRARERERERGRKREKASVARDVLFFLPLSLSPPLL